MYYFGMSGILENKLSKVNNNSAFNLSKQMKLLLVVHVTVYRDPYYL